MTAIKNIAFQKCSRYLIQRSVIRSVCALLMMATISACATKSQRMDVLIHNARIIPVTGPVIVNGSIAIKGGRIAQVSEGEIAEEAEQIIDARGQTVMPGMMDVHRHLIPMSGFKTGLLDTNINNEKELQRLVNTQLPAKLQGLLANGLTTVMSPTDVVPEIYELRTRVQSGALQGPRILTAGRGLTAPGDHPAGSMICQGRDFCRDRIALEVGSADAAREAVKQTAEEGADLVKVVIDRAMVPNSVIKPDVLRVIVDQSEALGLKTVVHVLSVEDMKIAIGAGADGLAHTPVFGSIEEAGLGTVLADKQIPVATTVAFMTPAAAAKTRRSWNEKSYRQVLANIRHMVDKGVVVALSTDSPEFLGDTEFFYEVEALSEVLSAQEVIETLTVQAARYLGLDVDLGTLEAGKVADLIIINGDPLADLHALKNISTVIKEGKVVVQKR